MWFSKNEKSELLKHNDKAILDKFEDAKEIVAKINNILTPSKINEAVENIKKNNLSENFANSGENTYKIEINDTLNNETKKL